MQRDKNTAPTIVRRAVLTNTLSTFSGTLVLMLINVLNGALTGRMLGPEGKGILVLVGLVVNQISYAFSLGVETAIVHLAGRKGYNITYLSRSAMGIAVLFSFPAMLMALALLYVLGNDFPVKIRLLSYFSVLIIFPSISTIYLQYIFRASGRISENAAVNVIGQVVSLVSFVLALLNGFNIVGALIAYYFATIATFVIYLVLGLKWHLFDGRISLFGTVQKELVSYGLKGHLGSLLQLLNYRIDLYIIALFLPSTQVGLYSVSIVAAELIWIVPNVLAPTIMQEAATRDEKTLEVFMGLVNRLTSFLLLVIIVFWMPLGGFFIGVIYGNQFADAYAPFLLLVPGTWALGMWKNLINDLSVRGYPIYKTLSTGISVVVLLLFLVILVRPYGIQGAAIASTIAYFAALASIMGPYAKILGIRLTEIVILRKEDFAILHSYVKKHLRLGIGVSSCPILEKEDPHG